MEPLVHNTIAAKIPFRAYLSSGIGEMMIEIALTSGIALYKSSSLHNVG